VGPPETRAARPPAAAGGGPGTSSLLPRTGDDVTTVSGDGSRATAPLVAHAQLLLAGPNAVFDRLLVRHCPVDSCAYSHLHYVPVGSWRQPLVRAPRCRPSLRYRIEIVDVLPAVVVSAGQRRRGAA
jgi:hypothetical protein